MANRFQREPIIAGDYGVWGTPELTQDRAGAIGQLTAQLYNDAGVLKVRKGLIGFDNDSNKGVIIIDTITTISLVGLTASRWAIVEVYITGTTPTFTITSLAAENDPGAIPTTEFTDVYDPEKGGFYYVSNERLLGLAWINSGGSLEGIVNCLPYIDGFQGYSISDDANDFYYRWEKNVENTMDSNYTGKIYLIPNDSRLSGTWVLSAGAATSFTDVDFSPYVPKGVKAIIIHGLFEWTGNGVIDVERCWLRANGSAVGPDDTANITIYHSHLNAPAGNYYGHGFQAIIDCDENGIIEYRVSSATCLLYLAFDGYILPENPA